MTVERDKPRATTVDQIVEAVVDGIKSGRFAPGQRLIEADLTAELGVSRGPLREALGRLAAESLVVIEPYRGAIVRRLSEQDVVELFEVREVLEAEAARLAATRIDEKDNRARLEAFRAEAGAGGEEDTLAYMEENTQFHDLVVELAGNDLLRQVVSQLSTRSYRMQFRNILLPGAIKESMLDHEAVIVAILAGDAKGAERTMRKHVHRSLTLSIKSWVGLAL